MVRGLAKLRIELLPRNFDPLGNYKDRIRARAAGYRLLVHAEIEKYLEDRCLETALSAVRAWKSTRRPSPVLMGLLAFSERMVESAPSSLTSSAGSASAVIAWAKKVEIDEKIGQATSIYAHAIKNNHGVKEANLLALLLPLGLSTTKLDPTWLADMDSFGASRGLIAHASMVRTSIDPANELATVKRLVGPMRTLDNELTLLL